METIKKLVHSNRIYRKYFYQYREQKMSYGDLNPGVTFYVIRCKEAEQGLFNLWIEVARKVIYAISQNYIPVVDLGINPNFVKNRNCIMDGENVWNNFFRQPQTEYSIEEVYKSQNVILSYGNDIRDLKDWPTYNNLSQIDYFEFHFLLDVMGLNDELTSRCTQCAIRPNQKLFGVSLRREMEWGNMIGLPLYTQNSGHHQKGKIENYLKIVDEILAGGEYDAFFLASDDREGLELFKQTFGDKCQFYNRRLMNYFQQGVPVPDMNDVYIEFKDHMDTHIYDKTADYAIETWCLSKCDALLPINSSSNTMARIMGKWDMKILPNYFD